MLQHCNKCNLDKDLLEFHKDSSKKNGRHTVCKQCCLSQKKILQKRDTYLKNVHQDAWTEWFKVRYINPQCGVCHKLLSWDQELETPCFDHKTEFLPIKGNPTTWIRSVNLNKNNVDIWESCSFGILCRGCNLRLLTNERINWWNKVKLYISLDKHKPLNFDIIELIENKILSSLEKWKIFFEKYYGKDIHCQICDKVLFLFQRDVSNAVHFDHETHNTDISRPSAFYCYNNFNTKNVKRWVDAKFGILCIACNTALPTNDRLAWVKNADQYIVGAP